MITEKMCELNIIIQLENISDKDPSFREYLRKKYDIQKINSRYEELLDEFLSQYAND